MNSRTGTLYVVATPIGNLDDISVRARAVLSDVAVVAAEDTRRSGKLLERLGIRTHLVSCHEHNESERVPELLAHLQAGEDVALISDAGTPLISDPGFRLVGAAADAGIDVSPIPGCSAAVAAVSIAGLPTDAVLFGGFLPASAGKRDRALERLAGRTETIVLYESVHRIGATLFALGRLFGGERRAVLARELTKLHETVYRGTLTQLTAAVAEDPGAQKGEYTLVIEGAGEAAPEAAETDRYLQVLIGYLGVRQAADVTSKLLGVKKNAAYKRALQLRDSSDEDY